VTATTEIQIQQVTAAEDEGFVTALTDLINEVYLVAEEGLWLEGSARTTTEEVAALLRAEQIAVARLDGRLVGSIKIQDIDCDSGEFGMLALSADHRGSGIGRELVQFAEQLSRSRGHRTMQLELLVPLEWKHPFKEFLSDWYERMGYRVTRKVSIKDFHPALAPLLDTPCELRIYHKEL
jgi:GNAT superfamily N-acetyltransferase